MVRRSRFLLLPLLCALVGFTVAVGSPLASIAPRTAGAVKPRVVGFGLRYTNPFLTAGSDPTFPDGGGVDSDPQGFDLGDAAAGGSIVRYLSAVGGFLPYQFALKPLLGTQVASGGNPTPQLPAISQNGLVTGRMGDDLGDFLRFNVELTDPQGTDVRTGTFRIFLPSLPPGTFRFAHDKLPQARFGATYYAVLDTIGSSGPVTFSVVAGSVRVGGQAVKRLENLGLVLTPDGRLFGRVFSTVPITFSVEARDATGRAADARFATAARMQHYTLDVEQTTTFTTEMSALKATVRGSRVTFGKDSLQYNGIFDSRGLTGPELAASPAVIRIGTATFVANFNERGKATATIGKTKVNLALNTKKGSFSLKVTNSSFVPALGITDDLQGDFFHPLVLMIETRAFRTAEVLLMDSAALASGKYEMEYKLGTLGFSRAGAFQLLSVAGSEGQANGSPATRWLVRFLGIPAQPDPPAVTPGSPLPRSNAIAIVSGITSATFRIGTDFEQTTTLALARVRLEFKDKTNAGLRHVLLDPKKFVHRVETAPLSSTETGIDQAIDTKDLSVFPFGVGIQAFNGETGRIIIPNRAQWVQK